MSTRQTKTTERATRLAAFMEDKSTGAIVQSCHGNVENGNQNQNGQEAVRKLEQTMDRMTDENLVQEAQKAWETKKMDESA
ncbi:hypothetical protein PV11_06552 [Exophiala sideris]|uniref:Uncharacterized protein n=1 Tax=Exophiala sideris TaxID=1016849 RepID=A0A0D1YDV7_9EURO|nr:hypothetical protein PV11_06552 [Exophiala sideris]